MALDTSFLALNSSKSLWYHALKGTYFNGYLDHSNILQQRSAYFHAVNRKRWMHGATYSRFKEALLKRRKADVKTKQPRYIIKNKNTVERNREANCNLLLKVQKQNSTGETKG